MDAVALARAVGAGNPLEQRCPESAPHWLQDPHLTSLPGTCRGFPSSIAFNAATSVNSLIDPAPGVRVPPARRGWTRPETRRSDTGCGVALFHHESIRSQGVEVVRRQFRGEIL